MSFKLHGLCYECLSAQRHSPQEPFSLSTLAAFLRLGSKYEIPHLRTLAQTRFDHDFPSTLEQWDKSRLQKNWFLQYRGMLIDVINLARECSLLRNLPAAFARCCIKYSMTDVLRGKTRDDGSTAELSAQDRVICILGREKLLKLQTESFGWLTVECDDSHCSSVKVLALREHWFKKTSCFPFASRDASWETKYCDDCKGSGKAAMAAGRQKIWDQLPSVFDLPPWEELLKE